MATPLADAEPQDAVRWSTLAFAGSVALWFAFFASFRSFDFVEIDGPFRAFAGFYADGVFFHGNNHLLYPVDIMAWNAGVDQVFGKAPGPVEYVRRTQLMDAMAMAISLGLFLVLLLNLTRSYPIAVLGMTALGFSRAFLLHATNAAEPPVGFLWSMVATCLVALGRRGGKARWAGFGGGVAMAAAMATYQTMVLIGPALLALAAIPSGHNPRPAKAAALRSTIYLSGCLVGAMVIYGAAFWHQGIHRPGEMVRAFFRIDGGTDVYGGLSISKFVNCPVGLLGNTFWAYPNDYSGLRNLLPRFRSSLWPAWLGFLVLSSLVFAVLLTRSIGAILAGPSRRFRMYLPPTLLAIFFTGLAPIYWSPTYDKLWLQVNASLVVLISLVLSCIEPARSRWVRRMSVVAIAILVVSNMAWLVPSRRAGVVAHSREAEEFTKLMSPRDLLVVDWSPFSVFYSGAYSKAQHVFYFITMAGDRKVSVIDELRKEIRRTSEESGNVYFLGLVDQDQEQWKSFLGDRVGLPYDSIAEFREKTTKVRTIDSNGKTVTLYRLGPIVPTSVPPATP